VVDRLDLEETRPYRVVKDIDPGIYHPVVCVSNRKDAVNSLATGCNSSFDLNLLLITRAAMPQVNSILDNWRLIDPSTLSPTDDSSLIFMFDDFTGQHDGLQLGVLGGLLNNGLEPVANFSSSSKPCTALCESGSSFTGTLQNSIVDILTHDGGTTKAGIIYVNSYSYHEFSELISKVRDQSLCMGMRGAILVVLVYLMRPDEIGSTTLHRRLSKLNNQLKQYIHFIHVSDGKLQTTSYHCSKSPVNASAEIDSSLAADDLKPSHVVTHPGGGHLSNDSKGICPHGMHILRVKNINQVLLIEHQTVDF